MITTARIAFKEWASVVEALGSGGQILILRKGGIHEKEKKFDVTHNEFFLFPTFEHQNPKDLKPERENFLKKTGARHAVLLQTKSEMIPIRWYCVVEESFWISDEKTLKRLDPFHIWSWDCVKARFDWGEAKGLFGIVVRIFSLPEVLLLENQKRYGGCRSWVEFEKSLTTASLKAVLPDPVFKTEKQQILHTLKNSAPST